MPIPSYPVVQPDSGLTFPWAFLTRRSHTGQWGGQGQRVVERMIINWTDYVDMTAQAQLCGYAYVDNNGNLQRVRPWPHPCFQQLYIDQDQGISDVQPVGKPGSKLIQAGAGFQGLQAPYLIYPTGYVILTLVFTERRYFVGGGDPTFPPYSFVEFVDKGSAEYLALNTGSYQYTPGDPTVQAAGLGGSSFKQGLAVLTSTDSLTVIWRQVPHFWLHNQNNIATNILNALETVNSQTFLGYPPGVLRFDSHDKERKSYPIPVTATNGLPFFAKQISDTWAWDVMMVFKFRDPPRPPGAVPNSPFTRGHNLGPAPQAGPNGYWYPISSTPSTFAGVALPFGGGAPLYVVSDFNQIFQQAVPMLV